MQRDHVGLAVERREVDVLDAELTLQLLVRPAVHGQYAAAEAVGDASQGTADAAGADDAERLAVQVEADEPLV